MQSFADYVLNRWCAVDAAPTAFSGDFLESFEGDIGPYHGSDCEGLEVSVNRSDVANVSLNMMPGSGLVVSATVLESVSAAVHVHTSEVSWTFDKTFPLASLLSTSTASDTSAPAMRTNLGSIEVQCSGEGTANSVDMASIGLRVGPMATRMTLQPDDASCCRAHNNLDDEAALSSHLHHHDGVHCTSGRWSALDGLRVTSDFSVQFPLVIDQRTSSSVGDDASAVVPLVGVSLTLPPSGATPTVGARLELPAHGVSAALITPASLFAPMGDEEQQQPTVAVRKQWTSHGGTSWAATSMVSIDSSSRGVNLWRGSNVTCALRAEFGSLLSFPLTMQLSLNRWLQGSFGASVKVVDLTASLGAFWDHQEESRDQRRMRFGFKMEV